MAKQTGWVPNQHGAWAMLIVPYLVGLTFLLSCLDHMSLAGVLIGPLFMVGYFWYHAFVLWLKSPAKRRDKFVKPVLTYGISAGIIGLVSLISSGFAALWWVPVFLPLILIALWLGAHKKERALLSGLVTVLAAGLQPLVMAGWDPAWLTDPACPILFNRLIWVTIGSFAYFFGTVLYVKSMVRKRGDQIYLYGSTGYHVVCFALFIVTAALNYTWWTWALIFAAASVRAWVLAKRQPHHPLPIKVIGRSEMYFMLAVALASLTPLIYLAVTS